MVELQDLMKNRRSIREFIDDRSIEDEILKRVINAPFFAPSAANIKGFHILIVDESGLKQKIRDLCEKGEYNWVFSQPTEIKDSILSLPNYSFQKAFLTKAPILMVYSVNPKNPLVPYAVESCWLAIAYMLLEIENSGLGSLTYTPSLVQTEKRNELNKILNLPKEEIIQAVIPVGYFKEKPEPKTVELSDNVHLNQFRNPFF